MALSRGKQLVELALQKKSMCKDVNNNDYTTDLPIQSREDLKDKLTTHDENFNVLTDESQSDTCPVQFVSSHSDSSEDDINFQEALDLAEEQFFDFDDTVKDRNYEPTEDTSDSSSSENEIGIDHEEVVITESSGGAEKRPRGEHSWKKNESKRLRMEGEKYKGMAKVDGKWGYYIERAERILSPRNCSKRCQRPGVKKCSSITEDDRKNIFTKFWKNMTWNERKVYVNSLVGSSDVSQNTAGENSRRSRSYRYFLRKDEERICVCKNLFLSTLGIGERTVYGWIEEATHGIPMKQSDSEGRKRAQVVRHTEIRESARSFLESLPKLESHYCRASTSKLYLEPVFNSINALYQEYKSHCQNDKIAGKKLFVEVFNSMNLGLYSPKKDLCDTCCSFEAGNISEEIFNEHQNRKVQARAEKDRDKTLAQETNSVHVITMDVQSVLLCPKLNASALYYKMKLASHNFTIFDLSSKNVTCYFWHEGQGDLTGNSFASCIAHYIESILANENGINQFIIYSDGCGYQNRNCTLANTLSYLSRKLGINITQKYLEKGHTQMEVDSVHSVIERKIKRKNIYVPQNYVELMGDCRQSQPFIVHYVDHKFFKKYSDLDYYSSIRPGSKVGEPVVADLRVLHYHPNGTIQYKIRFDDELMDLPRKARNLNPSLIEPQQLHTAPLKIKKTKHDHLQSLKAVVPSDYHAFYDSLDHD